MQQVAVGGADKARLRHLWCELLGLTKTGDFRSERENVDEDITVAGRGVLAVEVDLMSPLDPEKKPRVGEPPLNHVALWVDELPGAVRWLEAQGVRLAPGGIRRGGSGFDIAFIHPRGSEDQPYGGQGVLIELVQAPPAVIAAFDALPERP